MAWVFVLVLNGATPVSIDFDSEWACKDAGRNIVKTLGEEKAVYWCFKRSL